MIAVKRTDPDHQIVQSLIKKYYESDDDDELKDHVVKESEKLTDRVLKSDIFSATKAYGDAAFNAALISLLKTKEERRELYENCPAPIDAIASITDNGLKHEILSAKDNDGNTALMHAANNNNDTAVESLRNAVASIGHDDAGSDAKGGKKEEDQEKEEYYEKEKTIKRKNTKRRRPRSGVR